MSLLPTYICTPLLQAAETSFVEHLSFIKLKPLTKDGTTYVISVISYSKYVLGVSQTRMKM